MLIAQISDTHIALDTPDREARIRDLADTVADIAALDPLPDAVVHTGDVAHWGRGEEYAIAARLLAALPCPVYLLAGNRDDRANLRAVIADRCDLSSASPFVQYAIEDHAVRLIALDTQNTGSGLGHLCAARLGELARMLDRDDARPVAIFMHHPPFEIPAIPDPLQYRCPEAVARFARILDGSRQVAAVFCGHVHRAAAGAVAGVPALAMPSTCTGLRKGNYPAARRSQPLYLLHRYDASWGFATATRFVMRACEPVA